VARWSDLYDTLRDLDLDVRRHIYIEEELLMPLLKRQTV
jgi:iron-sulfur cluster repair protein YtfE (RIC family)